ncbi:MAG: class I SAM-dependent methyltransferase [Candidatus Omnitrophica bacterium]|nr:class I SAM-dependent methyltransferase [Candidatus Omnitrophota bacterium]
MKHLVELIIIILICYFSGVASVYAAMYKPTASLSPRMCLSSEGIRDFFSKTTAGHAVEEKVPYFSIVGFFHRLGNEGEEFSKEDNFWAGLIGAGIPGYNKERIRQIYGPIIEELKKNLGSLKGKKILEIGAGYGELLEYLQKEEKAVVYGLEPSSLSVQLALRREINVKQGYVKDVPWFFCKIKFDAVISARVFEPIGLKSEAKAREIIREINFYLKDGGVHIHATADIIYKRPFELFFSQDRVEYFTREQLIDSMFNHLVVVKEKSSTRKDNQLLLTAAAADRMPKSWKITRSRGITIEVEDNGRISSCKFSLDSIRRNKEDWFDTEGINLDVQKIVDIYALGISKDRRVTWKYAASKDDLPVKNILITQPDISFWRMFYFLAKQKSKFIAWVNENPIIVIRFNEKYYCIAGNHRLLYYRMMNIEQIQCQIINVRTNDLFFRTEFEKILEEQVAKVRDLFGRKDIDALLVNFFRKLTPFVEITLKKQLSFDGIRFVEQAI